MYTRNGWVWAFRLRKKGRGLHYVTDYINHPQSGQEDQNLIKSPFRKRISAFFELLQDWYLFQFVPLRKSTDPQLQRN